jgi:hypothetical protein
VTELELDDIQGNVLRGYKSDAAAYAFLTVNDPEAAKAWLTEVRGRVQTAARPPSGPTLNIAVSHPGLRALEVDEVSLESFPVAFQDGMAARAVEVLGDRAGNAPEHWDAPFRDQDARAGLVAVRPRPARRSAACSTSPRAAGALRLRRRDVPARCRRRAHRGRGR